MGWRSALPTTRAKEDSVVANYVDGFVIPVPKRSPKKMPFDGKRLIYGGFKVAVDA